VGEGAHRRGHARLKQNGPAKYRAGQE
jgi:hypothetical protein